MCNFLSDDLATEDIDKTLETNKKLKHRSSAAIYIVTTTYEKQTVDELNLNVGVYKKFFPWHCLT